MSDLVKWNGSGELTPSTQWGTERSVASIKRAGEIQSQRMIERGKQDMLRVNIVSDIVKHVMQRDADLNAERVALAGGDEVLNMQLARLQMEGLNVLATIIREQRW